MHRRYLFLQVEDLIARLEMQIFQITALQRRDDRSGGALKDHFEIEIGRWPPRRGRLWEARAMLSRLRAMLALENRPLKFTDSQNGNGLRFDCAESSGPLAAGKLGTKPKKRIQFRNDGLLIGFYS